MGPDINAIGWMVYDLQIPDTSEVRNYNSNEILYVGSTGKIYKVNSLTLFDTVKYLFGYGPAGFNTLVEKIHQLSIEACNKEYQQNQKELQFLESDQTIGQLVEGNRELKDRIDHIKAPLYKMHQLALDEKELISNLITQFSLTKAGRFSLAIYQSIQLFIAIFPFLKPEPTVQSNNSIQARNRLFEILDYEIRNIKFDINPSTKDVQVWESVELNQASYSLRVKINNYTQPHIEFNIYAKKAAALDTEDQTKERLIFNVTLLKNEKNEITLSHADSALNSEERSIALHVIHQYLYNLGNEEVFKRLGDLPAPSSQFRYPKTSRREALEYEFGRIDEELAAAYNNKLIEKPAIKFQNLHRAVSYL